MPRALLRGLVNVPFLVPHAAQWLTAIYVRQHTTTQIFSQLCSYVHGPQLEIDTETGKGTQKFEISNSEFSLPTLSQPAT